jgi:hypothetical protein
MKGERCSFMLLNNPDIDWGKIKFVKERNGYKLWSKDLRVRSLLKVTRNYVKVLESTEAIVLSVKLNNAFILLSYINRTSEWLFEKICCEAIVSTREDRNAISHAMSCELFTINVGELLRLNGWSEILNLHKRSKGTDAYVEQFEFQDQFFVNKIMKNFEKLQIMKRGDCLVIKKR